MAGSNASKWSKSRFADHCKLFFQRGHCRGVLSIDISPNWQTEDLFNACMLCRIIDTPGIGERVTNSTDALCQNTNTIIYYAHI